MGSLDRLFENEDANAFTLLFSGPRHKLTFRRTGDPPKCEVPDELPGAAPFLVAVRETSDSPPNHAAATLLAVRAKHEEEVRRGGLMEAGVRMNSLLCSCWTYCLAEREFLCGDGADVAVALLVELLAETTIRSSGILLDGLARSGVNISASATQKASTLLQIELAKELFPADCVSVWLDIMRQFHVTSVEALTWYCCRDRLLDGCRWAEAVEFCAILGEEPPQLLNRMFAHGARFHEEIVRVSPQLSAGTQSAALQSLVNEGCMLVAERLRRACGISPCPDRLKRHLRVDLIRHLVLKGGLKRRATQLAASAGLQDDVDVLDVLGETRDNRPEIATVTSVPCVQQDTASMKVPDSVGDLTMDSGSIFLVNGRQSVEAFSAWLSELSGIIGLDCEWQPGESNVSICQVAVSDCVWILDILWVRRTRNRELVLALSGLFANPSLLKLGFAFQEDFDRLAVMLCEVVEVEVAMANFVDLQTDRRGLAALLQAEAGIVLDKALQCSAWGQRPLSDAQIKYAALDAYCLLPLYDLLRGQVSIRSLKPRIAPWRTEAQPSECLPVARVRAVVEAGALNGVFVNPGDIALDGIQVGNVVCFLVKGSRRPVAVITLESCKVSTSAVARAMSIGKRSVSLASASDCLKLFGFAPGSVPPVGLRGGIEVWMSTNLRQAYGSSLCFSAGRPHLRLIVGADTLAGHYGEDRWLPDERRQLLLLARTVDSMVSGSIPLRFACDTMLNRLAHKLRALDLDVVVVGDSWCPSPPSQQRPLPPATRPVRPTAPSRRLEESRLMELAEAGRAALTSSPSTHAGLEGSVYLLRGKAVDEQVREVCAVFGIDGDRRARVGSSRRCCACNAILARVRREQIEGRVPQHKFAAHAEFYMCSNDACATTFWGATAYDDGMQALREAVSDNYFPQVADSGFICAPGSEG